MSQLLFDHKIGTLAHHISSSTTRDQVFETDDSTDPLVTHTFPDVSVLARLISFLFCFAFAQKTSNEKQENKNRETMTRNEEGLMSTTLLKFLTAEQYNRPQEHSFDDSSSQLPHFIASEDIQAHSIANNKRPQVFLSKHPNCKLNFASSSWSPKPTRK